MSVRHKKHSDLPDGADPSKVHPSDWNDEHVDDDGNPIVPGRVYSSVGDPGSVGAGTLWVQLDELDNATYLQLWVRSDDNTFWTNVGWADRYGSTGTFGGKVYDVDGHVVASLSMGPGSAVLRQDGDPVGPNWWGGQLYIGASGLTIAFLDHTGTNLALTLGPGGLSVSGLPTSNPGGSGVVWNDGGTLKIT